MAWQLLFDTLISYDAGKPGISVPVRLQSGGVVIDIPTKLDTGSTYCVFERMYGEKLGFDIESGHRQLIGTATGSFVTYGHEVNVTIQDYIYSAMVYFAADHSSTATCSDVSAFSIVFGAA
jgi:hypothetical protein